MIRFPRFAVHKVNGLIENYLSSERTIILAIVPANQDVATVDILERAKKVHSPCPPLRRAGKTLRILRVPQLRVRRSWRR